MRHDSLITPRIYDAVVVLGFDKKKSYVHFFTSYHKFSADLGSCIIVQKCQMKGQTCGLRYHFNGLVLM